MNEQEFEEWGKDVDKVFYAQIILDKLKEEKKINRKQYREIRLKIKKLRYKTFLNSPHLEFNPKGKLNAIKMCVEDLKKFLKIKSKQGENK